MHSVIKKQIPKDFPKDLQMGLNSDFQMLMEKETGFLTDFLMDSLTGSLMEIPKDSLTHSVIDSDFPMEILKDL